VSRLSLLCSPVGDRGIPVFPHISGLKQNDVRQQIDMRDFWVGRNKAHTKVVPKDHHCFTKGTHGKPI